MIIFEASPLMEPSLFAIFLAIVVVVGGTVGWRKIRATQAEILSNTQRILAICESVETFYSHACESRQAIELAVAAGIAHETLQETLQMSLNALN